MSSTEKKRGRVKVEEDGEVFTAAYLKHVNPNFTLRSTCNKAVNSEPESTKSTAEEGKSSSAPQLLSRQSAYAAECPHSSCSGSCSCAIYQAVAEQSVELIMYLIQRGADVNAPNFEDTSPLVAATTLNDLLIMRILLEHGANTDSSEQLLTQVFYNTPLCIATYEENIEAIDLLIDFGAQINAPGKHGWTPVMIAAQNASNLLLVRLIELGADINQRGLNDMSALELAAISLHVDTVILLVHMGADISSYMKMVAPITTVHDMLNTFRQVCCGVAAGPELFALFAVSNLVESVHYSWKDQNNSSDDDVVDDGNCNVSSSSDIWEKEIAHCVYHSSLRCALIQQLECMTYDIRRRFVQIADRVFCATLSIDGDIIPISFKARRYIDLLCLFMDVQMMRDVMALRLTCKSNLELRRFPVYSNFQKRELDTNLIESYVAYNVSYFVTAKFIQGVLGIHDAMINSI